MHQITLLQKTVYELTELEENSKNKEDINNLIT